MSYIFYGCSKIENIYFNFITNNTQNMNYMFALCTQIKTLDLRNFNTEKCNSFTNIFQDCKDLTVYIKSEHNTNFISQIPEYVKKVITG